METRDDVREGMVVRDVEGRRVGRVRAVGERHFELEPSLLSRDEFLVDYEDVRAVREGEVLLVRASHPERVEDDDGGALPPRRHANQDAEPVNASPPDEAAAHGP